MLVFPSYRNQSIDLNQLTGFCEAELFEGSFLQWGRRKGQSDPIHI